MLAAFIVLWLGLLIALPPRPSPWIVAALTVPIVLLLSRRAAQRDGRPWPAFVRDTLDLHALGIVLAYALGVQLADTHGVTTDGVTYFTQLRSLVFDRDLDVAREYAFLGQPPRPNHVVPVGPVLVWLPMYLAVAAVDGVGRLTGAWPTPADPIAIGLGLRYVRAALISSFLIGAVGVIAVLWHLRGEFRRGIAFTAALLIFAATPLYWYMVYEPSMTHAASFGFVALFVVGSARWVPRGATTREAVVLGTLLGLAFVCRSQEALFALYPGLIVLAGAAVPPDRVRAALQLAAWAFVGALPWIVLQLIHSYVLFTRYDYNLLGQGGYLNPLASRWIDTLFSSWHGFLSWTPVAYVAVIGTIAYLRRQWTWAAAALAILLLTAWVNGATVDWAGGWSFGGRRFTSLLVMLAPGLALVLDTVVRRPLLALAPLVAAALWWNHLLMVQYTAGMLPKDEPVSFGRIVRQQAELQTRSPFWYPFAFPANLWFAWREGVPVDKYDVLSPVTPQRSIDLTFDRTVEKYLLDGWDAPGGDDWGPAWWIGRTPATMTVPLAAEAGGLRITVKTRTRFDEPPVRASLALDVNGREIGRFDAGVPDATEATMDVPAEAVPRIFRRGYNEVAFRSLGVTRLDASDTRPPGPLAARGGVWPVAVYTLRIEQSK